MPALLRYRSLVSLAEAWPFRSPSAHADATISLVRRELDDRGTPSGRLAASLESEARILASGHSIVAIAAIRDSAWFPEPERDPRPKHMPLHSLLMAIAERRLRWAGDKVELRVTSEMDGPECGLGWRELSLQLPQDLLVAGLTASMGELDLGADQVQIVGPGLARVLEGPVSETHLHVGAAFDFADIWLAVLSRLTEPQIEVEPFEPAPVPFSDARAYIAALTSAALLRHLIQGYLWRVQAPTRAAYTFMEFLDELPTIARRCGSPARADIVLRGWHHALTATNTGLSRSLSCRNAELRHAHRLLWGPKRRRGVDPSDLYELDPLAEWLPTAPGHTRPETRMLTLGLRRLSAKPEDTAFARVFWQYVRIRNLCFGHLVERPGTGGLDWFTRHFKRLRPHRGELSKHFVTHALRLQSQGLNLAAFEARTSPDTDWTEVRRTIRAVATQARAFKPDVGKVNPEVALILHFLKQPEDTNTAAADAFHMRHGAWFRKNWRCARAIEYALKVDPKLLMVLRGIDVASHELALPNWPLVPIFNHVRAASQRAALRLSRARPSWKVPPLRTTLHAGEEFRRPVEGLRRIHEAIEFGLLRRGDRIGHGLVLGWPMARWCQRNARVMQPREERLDDLLWEFERYTRGQIQTNSTRLAFVRAQISTLGRRLLPMYHEPEPTPEVLALVRRRLFDPRWLRDELDYPSGRGPRWRPTASMSPELGIALTLLTNPAVHELARTPVEVDVGPFEEEFLVAAQTWLINRLAGLHITIEANPSSNLIIGDFDNLSEHPTFELAPWDAIAPRLPVSINTDDPLTFASKLADEYAYMAFALESNMVSSAATLRWLRAARDAGWESRFSLPMSARVDLLAELDRRSR